MTAVLLSENNVHPLANQNSVLTIAMTKINEITYQMLRLIYITLCLGVGVNCVQYITGYDYNRHKYISNNISGKNFTVQQNSVFKSVLSSSLKSHFNIKSSDLFLWFVFFHIEVFLGQPIYYNIT